MIVHFMYQFDWVTGRPHIWLNFISGVFVRVFLEEISVRVGGLSGAVCPPNVNGRHPIP